MTDLITRLRRLRDAIESEMLDAKGNRGRRIHNNALDAALSILAAAGFTEDGCDAADEIERLRARLNAAHEEAEYRALEHMGPDDD